MSVMWWRSATRLGLVVLGALVVGGQPAASAEHARHRVAPSGMQAHVDPATGRLVPEAVVPLPAGREPAPLPLPSEEPAPGGGMMSVLHGRFMNSVVATVEADGSVRIDCHPADDPADARQ
jgi:hypothetical protein